MKELLAMVFCLTVLSTPVIFAQNLPSANKTETNAINQAANKWTADDIIMSEQASGVQISPDCGGIVWAKSVPNKEKDSQLWLMNPFGGEPWKISDFTREISDYVWADNDTIIFSAKEEPTFYEKSTEKDDAKVIEDEKHASPVRLFKFDIKSKEITRLTDNTDRIDYFYLSPDGGRAVTVHEQSLTYSYNNKIKPLVFLYNLKTGERKQIFSEPKFNIDDIVWAKDGKGFYASSDFKENPRYLWAVLTEMYYYDLEKAAPVKVNLDWENGLTGSFVATDNGFIALLANGVRNKIARYIKTRSRMTPADEHSNLQRYLVCDLN